MIREATKPGGGDQQSSYDREARLPLHHVGELETHLDPFAERKSLPVAARGDRRLTQLDEAAVAVVIRLDCLLYTSPSPRD